MLFVKKILNIETLFTIYKKSRFLKQFAKKKEKIYDMFLINRF